MKKVNIHNISKEKLAWRIICIGVAIVIVSAFFPWMKAEVADGIGVPLIRHITGKQWSQALLPLSCAVVVGIVAQIFLLGKLSYLFSWVLIVLGVLISICPLTVCANNTGDFIRYILSAQLISDRYTLIAVAPQWIAVWTTFFGAGLIIYGAVYSLRYPLSLGGRRYFTQTADEKLKHEQILSAYEYNRDLTKTGDTHVADGGQHSTHSADYPDSAVVTPVLPSSRMLWDAMDRGIDITEGESYAHENNTQ